ncbi:hypothetical protein ORV05_26605 [Amycolatopsis cynarae]|uniref:Uncharacterized protein n=1 Tax=Amycolatopsis cynarae TaxID=2995223 RepID=A0ABY7AWY1_9PSEU|nr:hypothetical protein [Amycolatopsis sp. HUAS 11-8]WAL64511.1 hypothetical protein ORV05_26605 [Amycolatopsis sp. HUAS 11-8]
MSATVATVTFIAFIAGALWSEIIPAVVRFSVWYSWVRPLQIIRTRQLVKQYNLDKAIEFENSLPTREESRFFSGPFLGRIEKLVRLKVYQKVNQNPEFRSEVEKRLYKTELSGSHADELDEELACRTVDIRRHTTDVVSGARRIPTRLLGKEMEIWNLWDRLRAEGDFRCAVASSTAVLILVTAVKLSPILLSLLPLVIILWIQGEGKYREAFGALYESLISGRVAISELERIGEPGQTFWFRAVREPLSEEGMRKLEATTRAREKAERDRQEKGKLKEELSIEEWTLD